MTVNKAVVFNGRPGSRMQRELKSRTDEAERSVALRKSALQQKWLSGGVLFQRKEP